MSRDGSRCDTLVLLVGGNPLPGFLATAMLRPRRAVLAHTEDTAAPMKRLASALPHLGVVEVTSRRIDDPTRADAIRSALRGLRGQGTHLHYTGGTKAMAVHAYVEVIGNLDPSQASYIDERRQLLRFDDGREEPLREVLDLDTVLALQELRYMSTKPRPPLEGGPTAEDATELLRAALQDPGLPNRLYRYFHNPQGEAYELSDLPKQLVPEDEGLRLSRTPIPQAGWGRRQFRTWRQFLCGGWLEVWVASVLREEGLRDVRHGLHLLGPGRDFELDVVGLLRNRVYFASCTTDRTLSECKRKVFEARARAQQLAGNLTRSALISMLDERGTDLVRQDVKLAWGAAAVPAVFGLADLRAWAGLGAEPDRSGLRAWLEPAQDG